MLNHKDDFPPTVVIWCMFYSNVLQNATNSADSFLSHQHYMLSFLSFDQQEKVQDGCHGFSLICYFLYYSFELSFFVYFVLASFTVPVSILLFLLLF